MQDAAERGETPVPDLRNLDIYYEIGADIVLKGIEFEDEIAYRRRYSTVLAQWNANAPIPPDSRLLQSND